MPYTTQCHVVASGSFPQEGIFMFVPSKVEYQFDKKPGEVLTVLLHKTQYYIGEEPPSGWWVSGVVAGKPRDEKLLQECLDAVDVLYEKRGAAYAVALEDRR